MHYTHESEVQNQSKTPENNDKKGGVVVSSLEGLESLGAINLIPNKLEIINLVSTY
jgi:hypothetical protein